MSDALIDLPDELKRLLQSREDETDDLLDAIGVEIAGKRDEAVRARSSSGIEGTWMDAEEAYLGIDDANRHEWTDARWAKPMSMDGPVTAGRQYSNPEHRSTVFLRLTSRYVDAGAAKLGEILLPADDKAFSFSETPVPELVEAREDESQVVDPELGPLTRAPRPGESAPAGPDGAPQRVPLTVKDLALEKIEMARKRAKAAETRIYDWMVECGYRAEIRKVIFDAARIGVGVLKAPIPRATKAMAVKTIEPDPRRGIEGGFKVFYKEEVQPSAKWVDPWNCFPDPACGENIHEGDYFVERDYMSARQVRALKKLPGYITRQIDKVLKEGPDKANEIGESNRGPGDQKTKERFQVWYYYGVLSKDEMEAIDAACGKSSLLYDEDDEVTKEVYAIVTLINDSVVRATINPLDSGSFPYHSMPWQRRSQHWAGVGVAEQMRTPQKVTNAALRALLNNAGKSADNQYIIDQSQIVPADESWTITPGKVWITTNDGLGRDVRQAFNAIQIPNTTAQMMEIINLGERFAEETTSIPLITQGQSGATTPDTFGAAQLQNNNANQLLRSIGYSFDDYITEPAVRQFYEWLLLDPNVPNEEKGDFQIDAHGSIALVERAIQDQTIGQLFGMAANPAFGMDPKKVSREFLKSKKLNPDTIMYSEEEQEQMAQMPPPEAPQITVAKIGADVEMKKLVASQEIGQQTVAYQTKVAEAANALEDNKLNVNSTVELHRLENERQMRLLEYANRERISVTQAEAEIAKTMTQAKTQLAKTALTLQAQARLNDADNDLEMRKNGQGPSRGARPPVQLPGRASDGNAFEQTGAVQ